MNRVYRSLVWTGMAVAGLAACGDDVTVAPPPPEPAPAIRSVTVAPDNISVAPGATVNMTAAVVADAGATVAITWSVNVAATVATIDASSGVLSVAAAAPNGPIVVTATATATPGNATGKGVATINVGGSAAGNPTLSIGTITNNAGAPVLLNNVQGQINVSFNLERNGNPVSKVSLLLDGTEVASQSFTNPAANAAPALATETLVLSFNTADFDATTGVPDFVNGPHTLSGRAEVTGGSAPVAGNSVDITLNNADVANVTLTTSTPDPVAGPGGLFWQSGDLTATAVVVSYSSGAAVQFVTFTPDNGLDQVTDNAAPFEAVWPKASAVGAGSADIEAQVNLAVASAVGGNPGPSGNASLRLDNKAPAAGTFDLTVQAIDPGTGAQTPCCGQNWVGSNYAFADGYTPGADAGVGGVTGSFFALRPVPVGFTVDDVVANGTAVTTGADLATETVLNTDIAVAVKECDALGNCVNTPKASNSSLIGFDETPPTIDFDPAATAADFINNQAPVNLNYPILVTDETLSGISGAPNVAGAIGSFATSAFDLTNCFAPSILVSATSCAPSLGSLIASIAAGDASNKYTTSTFRVWDNAGNESNTLTRLALQDNVAPAIAPFLPPSATIAGAASATFSSSATDDNDLESADLLIDGIPVVAAQSLGTFGSPLTTSGNISATAAWIRSIGTFAGAAGPATTTATLRAFDVAGNVAQQNAAVATSGTPAAVGAGGTNFAINAAPTALCSTTADCTGTAGNFPTSGNVSVVVQGPSNPTFANPFTGGGYMMLTLTDGNGNRHYVATLSAPTATSDNGTTRTYTYTFSFSAASLDAVKYNLPDGAAVGLIAVGVTSAGDAVETGAVGVTIEQQ